MTGKFSLESLALCLGCLGSFFQKLRRILACDCICAALCQYQILGLLWSRMWRSAERTASCTIVQCFEGTHSTATSTVQHHS
eukprot:COSAG02_NODE_146_length_33985_cov_263.461695_7_plen_82_part_00